MMFKHILPITFMIFVLAACNALSGDTASVQELVAQNPTESPTLVEASTSIEPTIETTSVPVLVQATEIPTLEPTLASVSNSYNAPDWTSLPLVNARTGVTFTLADFAGKTVFIEPMATWCTNCRAQQGYVSQAMASLNADDFVFISVSVGENVSAADLAAYADRNGFPQIFVVASTDFTGALVQQFGFSATTPPSTPHFIISPTGTVSGLSTGYHQANEIIEAMTSAQNS